MKRAILLLAVCGQAWPACADNFRDDLDKLTAGLPKDAAAMVTRRALCNHWEGEEPYDRARAREIERAIRQSRCNSIEREESALRARYADKPEIIKALDAADGF